MKRTALAVTLSFIILGIDCNAQRISFTGKNIHLETFFSVIYNQTGYSLFYNVSQISMAKPVNIDLKEASLDTALYTVLKNQPFTFSIEGKTVFIRSFSNTASTVHANPNGFITVRGRVTDTGGAPVANASVTRLGTTYAVATNSNGNFELDIRKGDSLSVSSIGYLRKVAETSGGFLTIVLEQNPGPLEQVVVGGNLFAMKRKSDITSVTVIDSKTLETLPVTDIAAVYRGLVPGTNTFTPGDQPEAIPTLTIRGAGTETSISTIDVYIDGIEWAGGSAYLSSLNKENIDRIEILRGPESSTLYGTGSNGGIVQIFTKKAEPQTSQFTVRAGAGWIQSKWIPNAAFQQYYTINGIIGFKNAALSAGGTYQTNGAWIPGGGLKNGTGNMSYKWDPDKKLSVVISGYYSGARRGVSRSPLYDTCTHIPDSMQHMYGVYPRKLTNKVGSTHSYFAGLNLNYHLSSHWEHQLTAGFSQNDYDEESVSRIDTSGNVPDNFFQSLNKSATLRYSNLLKIYDLRHNWLLQLISGVDYRRNLYESRVTGSFPYLRSHDPASNNTGIFMQANPSYKNVYLILGLRYDYNKLFKNNHSWNPRLGLTTNFDFTTLIVKPRISWGSGITAPSYQARYGYPDDGFSMGAPNPNIKPQQQSGFDYAIEFFDRRNRFSGEMIYYDNLLKDIFVDAELPQSPNGVYIFQATNFGSIINRGWEFSGRFNLNRRFSANASFSIMHSVLKDTVGAYRSFQFAGKPPGYQLKYLPVHTAGLFLNYYFLKLFGKKDKGSISLNITEVDGILAHNGLEMALDIVYHRAEDSPDLIEKYWVKRGAIFRIGFHMDYDISDHFQLFAQGSNILNQNNVEFNSYVTAPGANWLFGIKFSY